MITHTDRRQEAPCGFQLRTAAAYLRRNLPIDGWPPESTSTNSNRSSGTKIMSIAIGMTKRTKMMSLASWNLLTTSKQQWMTTRTSIQWFEELKKNSFRTAQSLTTKNYLPQWSRATAESSYRRGNHRLRAARARASKRCMKKKSRALSMTTCRGVRWRKVSISVAVANKNYHQIRRNVTSVKTDLLHFNWTSSIYYFLTSEINKFYLAYWNEKLLD